MAFSKTIQMYIFDGNPNGRIMCELSNWNGRVYKISRNELGTFSERPDAENTGVYFLLGKDEDNVDTLYVGEAEKMLTRLKQHLRDTSYWSDCIVVVSKDNLLNKAHVKFLENKFYGLAKTAGRSVVINNTVPTCSSISEYDEAMLLEFISNAKLLVNTLGYKIFDTIEDSSVKQKDDQILFDWVNWAVSVVALIFIIIAVFKVLKGGEANVPLCASLANRAYGIVKEKPVYPQQPQYPQYPQQPQYQQPQYPQYPQQNAPQQPQYPQQNVPPQNPQQ